MKTSLTLKEKNQKATHGRLRKSIFRVGFERLKRCLSHPLDRLKELLEYMKLLQRNKMHCRYVLSGVEKNCPVQSESLSYTIREVITNLNELREKIILLFGKTAAQMYGLIQKNHAVGLGM